MTRAMGGSMPGVFALVVRVWTRGARRMYNGSVGLTEVGLSGMFSLSLCFICSFKMTDNFCKAAVCIPGSFLSSCRSHLMAFMRSLANLTAASIGVSVGILQCCG